MKRYLLKLLPRSTYEAMLDMGYSRKSIQRSANLIALSIVVFIGFMFPLFIFGFKNTSIAILMPLGVFLIILVIYQKTKADYDNFTYQKHYDFLFFAKLILSYLKANNQEESLTSVLRKLASRMEDSPLYNAIATLATEILNQPDDKQPFIDFARRASNTDLALDFSMALFDWSQKETKMTILERMEVKITEGWLRFTIEIKEKKLSRLDQFGHLAFYGFFLYTIFVMGTVVLLAVTEKFMN